MKLIVLLRNPIERAYSHWNMNRSGKAENMSFWNAITKEPDRCRDALPHQHRTYSYIDRGYYLEQLRRIWRYFSRKNVLVLKSELLKEEPAVVLERICDFLGVEFHEHVNNRVVHSHSYSSKMNDEEKEYLRHVFQHEIQGLESELGWDCSAWLGK